MVSKPRSGQSSRWNGAISLIIPGTSCLAWSLDITASYCGGGAGVSRRDAAIVARHVVPGTAPPQKSRPVGYGLIRAGVRTDLMIGVMKFQS